MNKLKNVKRKWIPGKKGKRGHFSACKRGHPRKGYGACVACRKAKDAARHAKKENKKQEARRKQIKRWNDSKNKTTHVLPDCCTVEVMRGSVLINSGTSIIILSPAQAGQLYLIMREEIATNYPSKLPKAFREASIQNPYPAELPKQGDLETGDWVCGDCGVKGTKDQISRADFHNPGCDEAKYCRVKAY